MDIKFPTDNHMKKQYNPNTGQFDRLWLRYGDGVLWGAAGVPHSAP